MGVEKEVERVFPSFDDKWIDWNDFCSKSLLFEYIPDYIWTIKCIIKRVEPGADGLCIAKSYTVITDPAAEHDDDDDGSSEYTEEEDDDKAAEVEKDSEQQKQEVNTKTGIEKVVEDIGRMWTSGEKSDVTLQVGDVDFKALSFILFARSPALSASLQHESKEKASSKISIEDGEPDVFRQYLQYLYTGSVRSFDEKNVFGLYHVAEKYMSDELKRQCLEHIRDTLSVRTFCEAVKLALTHGESCLLEQVMDFATENIRSIVRSTEWQNFIRDYPAEANEILIKYLGPLS